MIQRIGCPRLAASRTVVQLVSMKHFGDDTFLGGPFLPGQVQIEESALPRPDLWPSGHELGGATTFDVRPTSFTHFRPESGEDCALRTALSTINYSNERRQATRCREKGRGGARDR